VLTGNFKFAPHQKEAHERLCTNRAYPLFHEMGCFKTSTIIGHSEYQEYPKVLVVMLKGNLKTWGDELEKWTIDPAYMRMPDSTPQRLKKTKAFFDGDAKYFFANYDCLKSDKLYQLILRHAKEFSLIVFDECYTTHNTGSQRNKRWFNIRRKISRCVIMDGDPTAEGEIKLFGQYKMMDMGKTFGTNYYQDFLEKYFVECNHGGWVPGRDTKRRIREVIDRTAHVVRKQTVLAHLPPVCYEVAYPQLTLPQKKAYNQMAKEFAVELKNKTLEVDYKIAQLHKLRQITGGFCYNEGDTHRFSSNAKEHVTQRTMKQNKKLVIWCAYEEEIQIIKEISEKLGRKSVIYNNKDGDESKRRFAECADVNDFISNIDRGIGLNELVVADTALYYSRSEKRRSRSQSIARLDRPGQEGIKVTIVDAVIPGTIDEHIYKKLFKKGERSNFLLNYRNNNQLKEAIRGRI